MEFVENDTQGTTSEVTTACSTPDESCTNDWPTIANSAAEILRAKSSRTNTCNAYTSEDATINAATADSSTA